MMDTRPSTPTRTPTTTAVVGKALSSSFPSFLFASGSVGLGLAGLVLAGSVLAGSPVLELVGGCVDVLVGGGDRLAPGGG